MPRKKKQTVKVDENTTMEVHKVETGTLTRYQVRNTLFRLRDNRIEKRQEDLSKIVWAIIQPQLKHPENLNNFTFIWDVDPHNPVRVMRRQEWEERKAEMYPDEYKKQTQVEEEITLFTAQAK